VSGFVAPYPVSPELRAPVASIGEAGQVYRLGVLLARLLVGRTFAPGADAPHHESLLRRLAIRAMSRPGPPLPERLRNYLLAMLSWDPGQRPPLSAIASALDEAGGEGDSLLVWADREVPRRMIDLAAEPVAPDVPPVDEISLILPDDVSSEEHEGTLPRPGAVELDEDDRTAESVVGEGTARPARERGIMPVDVGPPAAIAARRPRLPRGVVAAEARSSTEPGRNVGVERLVAVLVLGSLFLAGAYGVFLFVALGEAR
jgi:hypothetical protein